jgi:hypothetical protein
MTLELQLQPLAEGAAVTATLVFEQLTPGSRYELAGVTGATARVDADDAGTARAVATLEGPTSLVLRPVASRGGTP